MKVYLAMVQLNDLHTVILVESDTRKEIRVPCDSAAYAALLASAINSVTIEVVQSDAENDNPRKKGH